MRLRKRRLIAAIFVVSAFAAPLQAAAKPKAFLPTGQTLTPAMTPGARFSPLVVHVGPHPSYVADGASAIAVSPAGREMLVLTSGYNRFNGADGKLVSDQSTQYVLRYAISADGAHWLQTLQVPNSFGGIAWQPGGRAFIVGGGVDDSIYLFARRGNSFRSAGKIPLGHSRGLGADVEPQSAGVGVSPDGRLALVANYYNDSVSLIDLGRRVVIAEQDLRPGKIAASDKGKPGGEFPYAVVWTSQHEAWVSTPRDRQVVRLAISNRKVEVTGRTLVIGEPTALLYQARSKQLVATEDNADRLAIIDATTGKLVAEPRLKLPDALARGALGKGLNPNSLAMLPDGHLLVTLGGINALAIVTPRAAGNPVEALLPTGWYPSAVAAGPGARLYIANRKSPPGPNPQGCAPQLAVYRGQPNACGAANQYIFQLEKAGLLEVPLPDTRSLAAMTMQVAQNIGLPAARERAAAEARMEAIRARIKHVVFIIKENRTYDQVLGDLPVGNGDPHLAILGEALSPNHHKLAREFVTLDNFFDSGEQSSTGWTWSTAARVPDLLEKTAPVNYAERGLSYEAEEADRFIYTQQTAAERRATNPRLSSDPDLLPGPALLTAPDPQEDDRPNEGFLWDAAIRGGLSVRNYGFADASVYDAKEPGAVPVIRQPFNEHRPVYTPGDRLLASRSDRYFRGFDQKLPDFWRVLEWQREYDEEEATGTLPQLTLLRLSHDHFGDFDQAVDGVNTVETEMADNDLSLGLVVERIARGKARGSTLVFVIEDDAQNGADHVDARRSIAFIVGPYVRHGALVSTRYTTLNMLRTIEAVLGLGPLSLNDGLASPMADVFDINQTQWTYSAQAADVLRSTKLPIGADRFSRNGATSASRCTAGSSAYWTAAMQGQDFRSEDRLDTAAFNRALWRGLGTGQQPISRDARDLRGARAALLSSSDVARCAFHG